VKTIGVGLLLVPPGAGVASPLVVATRNKNHRVKQQQQQQQQQQQHK
jgi:hypothetical protein